MTDKKIQEKKFDSTNEDLWALAKELKPRKMQEAKFDPTIDLFNKEFLTLMEKIRRKNQIDADKGDPYSQYWVGNHYYQNRDYLKAVEWFNKAAEQKYPDAFEMLAICYHNGLGVKQDKEKSKKLQEKAILLVIEQGHSIDWTLRLDPLYIPLHKKK